MRIDAADNPTAPKAVDPRRNPAMLAIQDAPPPAKKKARGNANKARAISQPIVARDRDPLAIEDGVAKRPKGNPNRARSIPRPIVAKDKERLLALENGVPKKAKPSEEISRPKMATETGQTKLVLDDNKNNNLAPKMAGGDIFEGADATKYAKKVKRNKTVSKKQPKAPSAKDLPNRAPPKHDMPPDNNKELSYWAKKPKGYIIPYIWKEGGRLAKTTMMRKSTEDLARMYLALVT
jgi:hypothetical protein